MLPAGRRHCYAGRRRRRRKPAEPARRESNAADMMLQVPC